MLSVLGHTQDLYFTLWAFKEWWVTLRTLLHLQYLQGGVLKPRVAAEHPPSVSLPDNAWKIKLSAFKECWVILQPRLTFFSYGLEFSVPRDAQEYLRQSFFRERFWEITMSVSNVLGHSLNLTSLSTAMGPSSTYHVMPKNISINIFPAKLWETFEKLRCHCLRCAASSFKLYLTYYR